MGKGINSEVLEKINVFVMLSKVLKEKQEYWSIWSEKAIHHNSWFTEANVKTALENICYMLSEEKLIKLVEGLEFSSISKKVGIIMAGNLPLVGFHDFLCVLLSGHQVFAKPSSQDPLLIKIIADLLIDIDPSIKAKIHFEERLNGMDAVIATGSDNSARYFEYYFSKIPHIIRKNRTSLGVLNGTEESSDLISLGRDIIQYFGLGCRNVSKLFVPSGYKWDFFFESIQCYEDIAQLNKYQNNYNYNKSVYLINRIEHLDNGFLLLTRNKELVSPLSVLFFDEYESQENLVDELDQWKNKIQVIVSKDGWYPGSISFGNTQCPEPWDYADQVNTLEFLAQL